MSKSKIAWTDTTWSPFIGCTPVSPGCENCWARREEDGRFMHLGRCLTPDEKAQLIPLTEGRYHSKDGPLAELPYFWRGPVYQGDKALEQPLHWRKGRTIFVCSRSDLFHKDISFEQIDKVFAVMALCPQHKFLVLTKRPERMAEYYAGPQRIDRIQRWREDVVGYRRNLEVIRRNCIQFPFENVGLGVTVVNQKEADEKIQTLMGCPAALHFLSIEPMLGPVDLDETTSEWWESAGIGWVIIGCESGKDRRRCELGWVQRVVTDCHSVGVSVFVKQLDIDGKVSHKPEEWPADLRVRQLPEMLQ